MKHFAITSTDDDMHQITPISPSARCLATHCWNHSESLVYPTLAGAEEAARNMDEAVERRIDRPWVTCTEVGGGENA